MCGIAGLYNSTLPENERLNVVSQMSEALKKRGPDGGDFFFGPGVTLGHRRLAIIAPSPEGLQPLHRNNLVITYNGELYNYLEERERLEKKGFVFKTQTDTEVILALYEELGLDFVSRLNGIFAFAIYEKNTGRLICVRDQFGIKPFLFSSTPQGFIFASELKALLKSNLTAKKISQQALQGLLEKGSIAQPLTMLEDVHHLMPGHLMILDGNSSKTLRYFYLGNYEQVRGEEQELTEQFEEKLTKAIHEQMVSDVPLGAFLSGGIDSSLIVALMKKKQNRVQTFSVGFEEKHFSDQFSEVSLAKYVAKHLETDHHEVIVTDAQAKEHLRKIIYGIDHPTIDGLNSYFVSMVAAKELRVSLSGTGADEILGGYIWFKQMLDYSKSSDFKKLFQTLCGRNFVNYYNSLHRVFDRSDVSSLLRTPPTKKLIVEDPLEDKSPLSRTSGLVMTGYLQNQLLADIDTASMCHSLEVRVPYLNPKIVSAALALPDSLKLANPESDKFENSYEESGVKKVLLNIGKKYLPKDFSTRKKRGFSLPMKSWLTSAWAQELKETLSPEVVGRRGLFDSSKVSELYNGYLNQTVPWTQVWLLMNIELWCQEVLNEK